jgi:hypothetical protein
MSDGTARPGCATHDGVVLMRNTLAIQLTIAFRRKGKFKSSVVVTRESG